MPTPLRTPDGWRNIEDIVAGALVLARDEFDLEGAVEAKVVEEVFRREGLLTRLRINGRDILTTDEHPFFVAGRGWVPCNQLQVGDKLATESGAWVTVEGVEGTGEWATVYNLRVADHHTYFVGCDEWGFSVWAHNADYTPEQAAHRIALLGSVLADDKMLLSVSHRAKIHAEIQRLETMHSLNGEQLTKLGSISRGLSEQDQAHLISELVRSKAIDADSASRLQNLNTLQRVVTQAADEVQNSPQMLRGLLSEKERKSSVSRSTNMGKAIERRIDELIAADPHLHGLFPDYQVTYRNSHNDVVGYIDWVDSRGAFYDATTQNAVQAHLDRPYGQRLGVAIWRGNSGPSWADAHWK